MAQKNIHIVVYIDTGAGTAIVVTPAPVKVFADYGQWFPVGGVLAYPDVRAQKIKVFSEIGGAYKNVAELTLNRSGTDNLAFSLVDGPIDLNNAITNEQLPDSKKIGFYQQNRVLVSEVNEPAVFEADKVYYIGENNNDRITGFAVNALPLSQGQFGQYPLYVFTENTAWALEQASDPSITFGRLSPVSQHRGAQSEQSITNVGRSVCVADKDGIYILGNGSIDEIGRAINDGITGPVRLAYYREGNNDELWVSTEELVFVYNLHYQRWYSLDKTDTSLFFKRSGMLQRLLSDGSIVDEQNTSHSETDVKVLLSPVHFGEPDMLKRIIALYVRAKILESNPLTFSLGFNDSNQSNFVTERPFFRPRHRSCYSFDLTISGSMYPSRNANNLHSIDAELESRYPRRQRSSKPFKNKFVFTERIISTDNVGSKEIISEKYEEYIYSNSNLTNKGPVKEIFTENISVSEDQNSSTNSETFTEHIATSSVHQEKTVHQEFYTEKISANESYSHHGNSTVFTEKIKSEEYQNSEIKQTVYTEKISASGSYLSKTINTTYTEEISAAESYQSQQQN